MVSQNVITLLLPLFLWRCKIKSVCFVAARLRVLATIRQGGVGMAGVRKKGCFSWQCIWLIDKQVVLIYKKAVATRLEARFYALGSLLLCVWKFILASG